MSQARGIMRLLAIGAHPDDVDILCGGTLALYAAAGHHVSIAIATSGNAGSATLTAEEIGTVRRREAEASCRVIGADLIWLGFDDEWLFNDRETRSAFIDAYRLARPDYVITHHPDDYHPDHRVTADVAEDARIPSAVRLVKTTLPALEDIPRLYRMDTVGGVGFEPEIFVDISETMPTKMAMVRAHASQRGWVEQTLGMNLEEFMRGQNALRGQQAGCELAEAFRAVATYPPARPDLPPLGAIVQS